MGRTYRVSSSAGSWRARRAMDLALQSSERPARVLRIKRHRMRVNGCRGAHFGRDEFPMPVSPGDTDERIGRKSTPTPGEAGSGRRQCHIHGARQRYQRCIVERNSGNRVVGSGSCSDGTRLLVPSAAHSKPLYGLHLRIAYSAFRHNPSRYVRHGRRNRVSA